MGLQPGTRLEHILLEHEVLSPELRDVLLNGAAGRTVVIEPRHRAVDLEAGHVEQLPLQRVRLHRGASATRSCHGIAMIKPTLPMQIYAMVF